MHASHKRSRSHARHLGLALTLALLGAAPAWAQTTGPDSYVAMAASVSSLGVDCAPGARCEDKRLGGHLRFGVKLSDAQSWDLGFARLDAVEVGYVSHGRVTQEATIIKRFFVGLSAAVERQVVARTDVMVSALTFDTLTRAPLGDDLQAWLRVGVAVVSTTVERSESGVTLGGVTDNRLAPHLGLGLDWVLSPQVALSGGLDMTRFSAQGSAGSATALHLGVKLGF